MNDHRRARDRKIPEHRSIIAQLVIRISLAAIVCCPSLARAAARSVVLLPLRGELAPSASNAPLGPRISHDLGSLYDMVDADLYHSTATQLSNAGLSGEAVGEVATRMRVDAVIDGQVRRLGNRILLAVAVREARTGAVINGGTYDLSIETIDDVVCDLVFVLEMVDPISQAPEDE
jgi:hypothetical protein